VYQALYLAFVPHAPEPGYPSDHQLLDGVLIASAEATGWRHSRLMEDRDGVAADGEMTALYALREPREARQPSASK
jgi:hypothetical protein